MLFTIVLIACVVAVLGYMFYSSVPQNEDAQGQDAFEVGQKFDSVA